MYKQSVVESPGAWSGGLFREPDGWSRQAVPEAPRSVRDGTGSLRPQENVVAGPTSVMVA